MKPRVSLLRGDCRDDDVVRRVFCVLVTRSGSGPVVLVGERYAVGSLVYEALRVRRVGPNVLVFRSMGFFCIVWFHFLVLVLQDRLVFRRGTNDYLVSLFSREGSLLARLQDGVPPASLARKEVGVGSQMVHYYSYYL